MILRRVMDHVKAQNWTAVALDFVIVVVGVFMGIQLGNWNERLSDGRRAENYHMRLAQEMQINRQSLLSRKASFAAQIEDGLFALQSISTPTDRTEAWRIVRSFFQASHVFPVTLQRGTYDEIISSGDLALLNDQLLVDALSGFHTFAGFVAVETIPDYRENLRRIVPFTLQQYLQSQCYEVATPDIHRLIDCPPPEDSVDLIDLAITLQSDIELRRDLQYMLSFAGVSNGVAGNRIRGADAVLEILSAKTGAGE